MQGMYAALFSVTTSSQIDREQVRSLWYHGFDNYMKNGKSAVVALILSIDLVVSPNVQPFLSTN